MGGDFGDLPETWYGAVALPITLLAAWIFAVVARWVLRGRAKLRTDTAIVISILSMSVGLLLMGPIDPSASLHSGMTILVCLVTTTIGIAIYGAISAHFQRPIRANVSELMAAGESDRVEYKSTARVNLHTGAKDPKMEHVIAKTINGYVNSDGGTLLIGVNDEGAPLGLEADYATLKSPDDDRFELWLRDLLTTTQGHNAAALVKVEFPTVTDEDGSEMKVCRLDCAPSPKPVYLKNKERGPELWVRNGNSTRRLDVDEAADYVMHRWPLGMGTAFASQVKAAVRFSSAG